MQTNVASKTLLSKNTIMKVFQALPKTYRDIYILPLFAMLITIMLFVISYSSTKNYYNPGFDFAGFLRSCENNSAYTRADTHGHPFHGMLGTQEQDVRQPVV